MLAPLQHDTYHRKSSTQVQTNCDLQHLQEKKYKKREITYFIHASQLQTLHILKQLIDTHTNKNTDIYNAIFVDTISNTTIETHTKLLQTLEEYRNIV